jgi:diguanylate cyclase (GGDEF)-like protein
MLSSEQRLIPEDTRGPVWYLGRPALPLRAVVLSFAALLVPAFSTLFIPERSADYELLLWLLSLMPAFFLAYYRGWRGVTVALAAGMAMLVAVQVILLLTGGRVVNMPLLVGVTTAYIAISLAIGVLTEMLHRERMRAERLALTDELTELPNRRYVRLVMEREFAAARRGRPFSIVFFDIDRFKQYNDRFGHHAGDDALRALGNVLARQTRATDISGRWGGEEFVAVLAQCEPPGALVFVERVKRAFREASLAKGALTVTAGVAGYHVSMDSPDDLLAAADTVLYEAKRAAVDDVRIYEPPVEQKQAV